jgi:hypothetical protein
MKKFIAIGITALGSFGLIGLGSTAAMAAPTAGSAEATVCTSAGNQLNSLLTPLGSATTAAATTAATKATANAAVPTAEAAYVTAAMQVIDDVDAAATTAVINADTLLFNSSITSFVNTVVASSAANVADFNAQAALTQLQLQKTTLLDLQSIACAS